MGVDMFSCECECEYDSNNWYYSQPDDFSLLEAKRRKRCCSCGELISIGACCVKFERDRSPRSDIEERLYGDEVPLAPYFMCENCGEIYFNLSETGCCIRLGSNMHELLSEYWNIAGFKKGDAMEGGI